jgi:hypothetical protein
MSATRLRRHDHGNGHSYSWAGNKIPGVTTVKGILDKPGLVKWAASTAADSVVNDWDVLVGMTPTERAAHVKTAHDRARNKAAVRGTRVHAVAERLLLGEAIDSADVPAEIRGMAESVARLMDAWEMEPVITESPVAHSEWLYAGTLDAVVTSPRLGNLLIDYKTRDDGRPPYSDVSLQLAAYRYADLRLREIPQVGPRGGKKPSLWVEEPMVDVDRCAVIAVTHDAAQLIPMRADAGVFDVFLHLLEVHETWIRRTDGWRWKDDPAYAPTVGEPIHPEDDETTPAAWQEEN